MGHADQTRRPRRPEARSAPLENPERKLRDQLAALERLSRDGICLFRTDGAVDRVNGRAAQLLGLNPSGTNLHRIHADHLCERGGEPLPRSLNPVWRAIEDGLPIHNVQVYWRRPDSRISTFSLSLEPLGSPAAGGHDVVAMLRDLVEAQDMASQLSELTRDTVQQRHLVHLVFDNVDSGVALIDGEDRLALSNQPFQQIWGFSPHPEDQPVTFDELLKRCHWTFTPGQRARFDAQIASARETFEPTSFEVETADAYILFYTCRLAGGRRLWALRDLTERRRMTQELEEAKEQAEIDRNLLRSVFTNVEAAIVVMDEERRVVAFNPLFASLWELPSDWLDQQPPIRAVAQRLAEFFGAERFDGYLAILRELQLRAETGKLEVRTRDGRYFVLYTSPLDNGGRLFSFQDITDRRRLEKSLAARNEELGSALTAREETLSQLAEANRKLEETDRLKSEFLANTSHELRTPLNSILGYLGLIIDRIYSDEAELRQFATTAHRSAGHLLAVINDLLDIARIESGRMDVISEPVSLWVILAEVCDTVRPQVASKGLRLELPEEDLKLTVLADPARLRQVLLNVIGNAVKFTDEGEIRIEVGRRDGTINLSVADTGIGIPPEKQATIFDKFVQADGSMARSHGGTGLGLAITHSLLELMHGRIAIRSDGPSSGTRVEIELPVP